MTWNALKFHLIRAGPMTQLKEDTTLFTPDYDDSLIGEEVLRDIGILQQPHLEFREQV